jgi:putative nucleotidyltransferase with HDIG domain
MPKPLTNGQLYKSLFENMLNGFAHCRAIYNDAGAMVDWIYVEVNHAFEVQTGIINARGKRVTELLPNILDVDPMLFEAYSRVAKGMELFAHFEYYLMSMQETFDISVYSVEPGTFSVVFQNISEQKKHVAELQKANTEILLLMVRTLKFRDKETDRHSERVTDLTLRLCKKMGMTEEEIDRAYRGALLHDIGKMFVPDYILQKPGPLTAGERTVIQQHTDNAFYLLSPVSSLKACIDIPYCHHEKWDGSGYPRGLKGDEIPLSARLFSIIDNYDALTSERSYRTPMSGEDALVYIREESGNAFDPALVDFFITEMKE